MCWPLWARVTIASWQLADVWCVYTTYTHVGLIYSVLLTYASNGDDEATAAAAANTSENAQLRTPQRQAPPNVCVSFVWLFDDVHNQTQTFANTNNNTALKLEEFPGRATDAKTISTTQFRGADVGFMAATRQQRRHTAMNHSHHTQLTLFAIHTTQVLHSQFHMYGSIADHTFTLQSLAASEEQWRIKINRETKRRGLLNGTLTGENAHRLRFTHTHTEHT